MTPDEEIKALQKALADADRVINRAICFPSASLPEHEIKWLTDKIQLSKDRYTVANGDQ